jgi:hypothetical protein
VSSEVQTRTGLTALTWESLVALTYCLGAPLTWQSPVAWLWLVRSEDCQRGKLGPLSGRLRIYSYIYITVIRIQEDKDDSQNRKK